tara:strand:- start:1404 stop:1676 length:273 start_codon:yes stop_codon:yes gene_type:complete
MTSEQLEQLAQLVADKILAELNGPTPPDPTFHTEVDQFGNVKYFNRKELLALQMSQLDAQRGKLLAEEKYELLIELEEIYNKLKKEHDKL